MWGGMFSKRWSSRDMKPKTAILLSDKLMLWHNIKQRHPPSLTTWSHCMTNTFTWHFHFLFWPTESDTRACPGSTSQQHLQHNTYVRLADARLQGVTGGERNTGLAAILTSCGAFTVPFWRFNVHEVSTTNLKKVLRKATRIRGCVCVGGVFQENNSSRNISRSKMFESQCSILGPNLFSKPE